MNWTSIEELYSFHFFFLFFLHLFFFFLFFLFSKARSNCSQLFTVPLSIWLQSGMSFFTNNKVCNGHWYSGTICATSEGSAEGTQITMSWSLGFFYVEQGRSYWYQTHMYHSPQDQTESQRFKLFTKSAILYSCLKDLRGCGSALANCATVNSSSMPPVSMR